MSRPDRGAIGRSWEDAASAYLAARGVKTLIRRYSCRLGELDLVCSDGDALIIVEVRARRTTRFASAAESVDYRKRRKLVLAARHLLMCHPQWARRPLRFDVVAFGEIETESPNVEWVRNAFAAD